MAGCDSLEDDFYSHVHLSTLHTVQLVPSNSGDNEMNFSFLHKVKTRELQFSNSGFNPQ